MPPTGPLGAERWCYHNHNSSSSQKPSDCPQDAFERIFFFGLGVMEFQSWCYWLTSLQGPLIFLMAVPPLLQGWRCPFSRRLNTLLVSAVALWADSMLWEATPRVITLDLGLTWGGRHNAICCAGGQQSCLLSKLCGLLLMNLGYAKSFSQS